MIKALKNVTTLALAIIILAASFACANPGESGQGGEEPPEFSVLLYGNDDYFEPDYHLADPASAVYTGDLANGLIAALK